MKKFNKIFLIIIIVFVVINIINVSNVKAMIDTKDYEPTKLTENDEVSTMAGNIIGGFQAIGNIVSILALVLIGIKYMLGSTEEKAEYKQTMIYYIIGAILVFAITNISSIIYNFAQNL